MPERSKAAIISSVDEELLVAVAPAQAHEVVAQSDGQIAERPIGIDAQRAMALGKFGAVGAVDQRDVGHVRHVPAAAPGRSAVWRAALVRWSSPRMTWVMPMSWSSTTTASM